MLLKSWARSRITSTPLVNLSPPLFTSPSLTSAKKYLEWNDEPLILRADCDEIVRGVDDTVTTLAPQTKPSRRDQEASSDEQNYRLMPPISVLDLASNQIGWMAASVLSTCLTVSLLPPLCLSLCLCLSLSLSLCLSLSVSLSLCLPLSLLTSSSCSQHHN
jgi:hypothetical protein